MDEMYYMMSGETVEDYFRHLNLDDSRRKYLENIKEGKQVDKETEIQEWNWRATFTDCRKQIFYVYEEIYDSPSGAAHSLERELVGFSSIGISYIFSCIYMPCQHTQIV
jgi:hypothetical protein